MPSQPEKKPPKKEKKQLPEVTPELMPLPYCEKVYGISHSGLYREINAGRIPLIKIGRASRIARADAEKWVASLERYTPHTDAQTESGSPE